MFLATASLPDDPIALRVFAQSLQAAMAREVSARDAEIYEKTLYIEKLKAQLAELRRSRFGRSSERLAAETEQLELALEDLEREQGQRQQSSEARSSAECPAKAKPSPLREAANRKPLPDHLPRERVEHNGVCACPKCGGTKLRRVGTDEREVLEYVPSHFKVVVHARPKFSCRDCETVTQPPMPSLPIERGRPGPGLLAHVLVSKYCDHLPLHRQSEIYAREGVDLDRSTMAEWVGRMTVLLEPLADAIRAHTCLGQVVHADDTPVPVLDPGRGRTKTGRLWVAVRDERPWGSAVPPSVFYRYAPDRKAEQAEALLKDCRGYLHADAYAGFNNLYEPDPITGKSRLTEVACWAHARRKIFEVHTATGSPAALALLESIGGLFALEKELSGQPPEYRLEARREHAIPILDALKADLESVLARIGKKTSLAQAIRYALTNWRALICYTTDGRLEICNNAAERAIRPLALGRKNWLFAGSDGGGHAAATIYTIIQTAKLNGADPEAYLRDIVDRIADYPARRIADLLPWNWAARP
jgi:transposase